MFDISFSELMLIGVIALIVIGPERLPKVARTIGHLLGRAQRYVNEVKTDIQKEMDLKDIGDLKNQMQDAARSVKETMGSSVDELKAAVTQPSQVLQDTVEQVKQDLSLKDPLGSAAAPTAAAAPAESAPAADSALAASQPSTSPDKQSPA